MGEVEGEVVGSVVALLGVPGGLGRRRGGFESGEGDPGLIAF